MDKLVESLMEAIARAGSLAESMEKESAIKRIQTVISAEGNTEATADSEEGHSQEWGPTEQAWHDQKGADPVPVPACLPANNLGVSTSTLRQGILWATILGPPRALSPYRISRRY